MLRRVLLKKLLLGRNALPVATAPKARLNGTFLQLNASHATWGEDRWLTLFNTMRRLRASEMIVQWSVRDGAAFYPSKSFQNSNKVLDIVLRFAAAAGIEVTLGLASDSRFWGELDGDPALLRAYLAQRLRESATAARELAWAYGGHPAFRGWYITEEIDDVHWRGGVSRRMLQQYLTGLCHALRSISETLPIGISGFAQGRMSPGAVAELWTDILRAGIDTVWFQDGIGAGKLDFTTLPLYLSAVQKATEETGRKLRIIVEVFQVHDPEPTGFRAEAAPFERVLRQLEAAVRFDPAPVVFSLPEYMSELGGARAKELLARYLAWQPSF